MLGHRRCLIWTQLEVAGLDHIRLCKQNNALRPKISMFLSQKPENLTLMLAQ